MRFKVFTIATALVLSTVSIVSADVITFDNPWGNAGFNIISQDDSGIEIVFSIRQTSIEDVVINGNTMQMAFIPGVFLPNNAGAPNLPGDGRIIAMPQGASANIRIISSETELFHNIDYAPAPPIPFENDDSPLVYEKNPAIYSLDAYYPANPVIVSEPSKMRGVDYVMLGITPFQYNPVKKELVVYKNLRVRVDFTGGNGHFGEDRLRNRYWEPVLRSNIFNYASLPGFEHDYAKSALDRDEGYEYLIIVPDDPMFVAWADTIKAWRTLQGIKTGIVTLTDIGGNSSGLIEQYINDAYRNWDIPPVAVLLLSDYPNSGLTYGITSPIWDNYCISDNIYADVDGDDLPDIAFARITAQTENHLSTMINKFLDYERNPPTNPDFYDHPITAGGWQEERWFILCTEICWGYWHNIHGKNPVREYAVYDTPMPSNVWSTNPNTYMVVNYFGQNGFGYIPENPSYLDDWGANAARLNNDINSGAFLMLHRDHGYELGWGEPDYDIGDLTGLNNADPIFVLSINCLTGKYNIGSQCFTEAFHRMNYGALGVISASESSLSFVNDTYIFGLFDYLWPDFDPGHGEDGSPPLMPCFASASGKYYLQASSWPYNPQDKDYVHHLFHHHGDAFITLYSEVPQNLTVSHLSVLIADDSTFNVTADLDALIGLTVDGEIIGVGMGTGESDPITIIPQIPGHNMVITVTKPNYFRYAAEIPIITESGPYIIYDFCSVNDINGNNNGLVDFGESIYLGIQLKNVGPDNAYDVTAELSTPDSFATITDNSETYGIIEGDDGISYIDNAFSFDVSSSVPDGHIIEFELEITDASSNTWNASFVISVQAPEITITSILINDETGNGNGILDAGETAEMILTLTNEGSAGITSVAGTIFTDDELVDITDNSGAFDSIEPNGGTSSNQNDPYIITANDDFPQGHLAVFDLNLTADNDYNPLIRFILRSAESFEYSDGGYIGTGEWQWGEPTYGPPEAYYGVNVWGVNLSSDYSANCDDDLICPSVFINSPEAELEFYQWYDIEEHYDGGNASISTNGGSTWFLITPTDNYPSNNIWSLGQPGYTGLSGGWVQAVFSLAEYVGQNVIFKWRFASDSYTNSPGWYIDDVAINNNIPQEPPSLSYSPDSYMVVADSGEIIVRDLDIVNNGEGPLYIHLSTETDEPGLIISDIEMPTIQSENLASGMNNIELIPIGYREPSDKPKAKPEPYYPPVVLDQGGPDEFGYIWIDSNEPNGPEYSWVDITSIGTYITGLGDDTNVGPFSIGFDFGFYDNTFSAFRFCTNGFVSFTSTQSAYSNQSLPTDGDEPLNLIAPFWDDLNFNNGGDAYYYSNNSDSLVISWIDVPHYSSGGPYTFQVILLARGEIIYQYQDMNPPFSSSTIGIQNGTGQIGLQIVYNSNYVENNLAVRIKTHQFWLTAEPSSYVIEAHDSYTAAITFDASELEDGEYSGNVILNSNDPVNPHVVIPVDFVVGEYLCEYIPGDINSDEDVSAADAIYGIRYFQDLGDSPSDSCYNDSSDTWLYVAGDVNGSCEFLGSDISFLVSYLRGINPLLRYCPQVPPTNPGILNIRKERGLDIEPGKTLMEK